MVECFSLSVSLSLFLCVSLSPSIYRATFLAIYLSTCLFMYLSIDLFIHLSTKLSIFLSIQPLSIHLLLSVSFFSVHLFIDPCPQLSISGNQLLELRTSLLKMPLVLRLPRKMHLCRSSSNLPRLPSFLKMLQKPHVLITFQWMHNPRHLPYKTTSERPKSLQDPQFLTLLTSKCASRHNAVHFFDISTSRSAPRPPVFNTFDFQMCFAPQRRAIFRHLNFQKCSETLSF